MLCPEDFTNLYWLAIIASAALMTAALSTTAAPIFVRIRLSMRPSTLSMFAFGAARSFGATSRRLLILENSKSEFIPQNRKVA